MIIKVKAMAAAYTMGVMSARTVAIVENWNFIFDGGDKKYAKEG
jgi:hypothetical protein